MRLVAAIVLTWSVVASADPVSTAVGNWTVDRGVFAIHRVGNTVYFGGDFTHVAPRRNNTGSFVVLSPGTAGAVLAPRVSGGVEAIVPDGTGGYYIGGRFVSVNGVPRANLAHILADGSLDPLFAPNPNNAVNAMVLLGSVLYAGGDFTEFGGVARQRLAGWNTALGTLTGWQPAANGSVLAMTASGSVVYIVELSVRSMVRRCSGSRSRSTPPAPW